MTYLLCERCFERHEKHPDVSRAPTPSQCFICQGALEQLPSLVKQALSSVVHLQWSNYCVQATFSRPLMVREEAVMDGEPLSEAMVIKNQANRLAMAEIKKQGKKPFKPDGELVIKLDFWHNAGTALSAPLFIFGHYVKKSREWCQHDWACTACRGKGCVQCHFRKQEYPAIETAFRDVFKPAFGASDAYLHASGREDVDVMCLGSGRPFVFELVHPQKRTADLAELGRVISEKYPLEVLGLKFVLPTWPTLVCTSHFDKHYRAWVEADRPLTEQDWQTILSALPIKVLQQTPTRVLRRRADLIRPRSVYLIKPVSLSPNEWVLDIHAEAGTYIKELIHGDAGRTKPSFTGLLGTPCRCKQLDVMGVDDAYLQTLADARN